MRWLLIFAALEVVPDFSPAYGVREPSSRFSDCCRIYRASVALIFDPLP